MRYLIVVSIVILGLVSAADADPTFFVNPNPYPSVNPTLDSIWQTAVGNNFIELDLNEFTNGSDIDSLTAGSIGIDLGLGGLNGSADTAEIFWGSYGGSAGGSYGTVSGGALLNRDASGGVHSQITFSFSEPVSGFGLWVFDNASSYLNSFNMIVTNSNGDSFTSNILESNNSTAHFVEGFIGATWSDGIKTVSIEVLDGNGDPVLNYFEVDHLQIVPAPGAVVLGMIGLGLVGWFRRRLT